MAGVLEAHGPGIAALFDLLSPRRAIAAMTLGHVVIARNATTLASTRAHERVHVRQCERWGPCFVPAYLAASALEWLPETVTRSVRHLDNSFEREASAGGAAWRYGPELGRCDDGFR